MAMPQKISLYIPLCLYFNLRHRWRRRNLMSFTFHYVSILIIIFNFLRNFLKVFTFHYVSILMKCDIMGLFEPFTFTFHYVSILIL